MAPPAGAKEVVLMCTGLEERQQNELYLLAQGMEKTQMVRDKVAAGMYDVRTSHLVVGPSFGRTDKLFCALSAGIPIVRADYVKKSHKKGSWLRDVDSYDVGRETEQGGEAEKRLPFPVLNFLSLSLFDRLYIPPLARRQAKKKEGGVFQGWSLVVLLEDAKQKEVYRRMLELGGAVVHRWTLTHLLDSQKKQSKEYKALTHIVARPGMLLQGQFLDYLAINDRGSGGPFVVTHIYLGDFLTKKYPPSVPMYDVRNPEMWPLTEERWKVEELQEAGLSSWNPPSQPEDVPWHQDALRQVRQDVALREQVEPEEQSPDFSDLEQDFDFPEMANSPETEERVNGAKRRRIDSGEGEEIEVLKVVEPSPSIQPPMSSVARLKAKAAELIRKEKQSKLDSWVITSPRLSQGGATQTQQPNSPESPVHQEPKDAPEAPTLLSPVRRSEVPASPLRGLESNNTSMPIPNHFLSLRRSGSINSSARSLFASDASQDGFDLDKSTVEEGVNGHGVKAKTTFCHTLQVNAVEFWLFSCITPFH